MEQIWIPAEGEQNVMSEYLPFRAPKLSRSVAGFQLFVCRHADFASRIICWNRLFPTILGLIEWGAYRMIRSRIPVVSLNIVDCKQQPSCHHMPIWMQRSTLLRSLAGHKISSKPFKGLQLEGPFFEEWFSRKGFMRSLMSKTLIC